MNDYIVVCPSCGLPMSSVENHFRCYNCNRTLTVKQANKQKNRAESPESRMLRQLKRDGKIYL